MKKYIMYLRKSQMDRDFEEVSVEETLARHKKQLTEFCQHQKIFIDQILEEVVSGESLSSRPQMMKCLELINTGEYEGVVCMDIDRLSRGSGMDTGYIMQVFQINGCKIITPQKTYDLSNETDEQFTDMKFLFSRYELKTITKRLVRGRNQSAAEGKYMGSTPPYGYEIVKLEGEKGNSLKVKPDEAAMVKVIFDMYVHQNLGYHAIANKLKMSYATVRNVICNPVYTGKIRWKYCPQEKALVNGKVKKLRHLNENFDTYEGRHAPIIDDATYQAALKIRSTKYHPPVEQVKQLSHPFVGILKCPICGRSMHRNMQSSNGSNTKPWFYCPTRGCNHSMKVDDVENMIKDSMSKWLQDYTIKINAPDPENSSNDLQTALDHIQNQILQIKQQQEKICDFLEKGIYTIEMFQTRNDTLQSQIKDLKEKESLLQDQLSKQSKQQNSKIIPTTQHLLDNYDQLDIETKNILWKEILTKITAERNESGIHIQIYPKI